jgi:glutaredoxin
MKKVILYSTSGCHLCEKAETYLAEVLSQKNFHLDIVDIAESDDLIERYGIRIPVIVIMGAPEELGWPFDVLKLRDFISVQ